jgi:hypothetical protein
MQQMMNRVTRLDEFSQLGRLFSLASNFIAIVVAQIFGLLTYFTEKVFFSSILTKNGFGVHLTRIFREILWSP